MSDRFPGHPGGIECLALLDQSLMITGCEDGKLRFDHRFYSNWILFSFSSAISLYPHRIMSIVGRTSSMPIQTLCTSCDTNYLISTSTSQETLQLIDSQQLKIILNKKKHQGGKRQNNAFFDDLETKEQTETDDSSDSDEDEMKKPRKKKKK